MGRGLVWAWLVAMGIVTWREVHKYHRPPPPGQYAAASGLFVLLAILAAYQPAEKVATLTAWGFDVAILLQPGILPGTGDNSAGGGRGGKGK